MIESASRRAARRPAGRALRLPTKYSGILHPGRAGLYAAPRLLGPLRAAARRGGLLWYDLDLRGVRDRDRFFERCQAVFRLPRWFGRNWDAWHEWLRDAAAPGARGAIVCWRNGRELARRSPETAHTALEILGDAAIYQGSRGRAFIVIVERSSVPGLALGPLR